MSANDKMTNAPPVARRMLRNVDLFHIGIIFQLKVKIIWVPFCSINSTWYTFTVSDRFF